MDSLRAMIAQKRKVAAEDFKGKKYMKRSDLEAARLAELREEEEAERKSQVNAHQSMSKTAEVRLRAASGQLAADEGLGREEVFRRLRALKQPVTLFGEDDVTRLVRLNQASASLAVGDEYSGAGTGNELQALVRQEKAEKLARARTAAAEAAAAEEARKAAKQAAPAVPGEQDAAPNTGEATSTTGEGDDLMDAFKAAAAAVAERREEANLPTEDRIMKHMTRWCESWRLDLEHRPAEIAESPAGQQSLMLYKSTMEYFKPMMRGLRRRNILPDLLAGIWMIVKAIAERNYLQASNIYMSLSVGNEAWPIGVTSIGIHERSSREKISHVMNTGGAAHIMNDEATRKYLQAMKRLLTTMQRLFPTDPSRCMDFDGFRNAGRGAAGGGSDRLALMAAEHSGNTWREHGMQSAPHMLDSDGSVKVPQAWKDTLKQTYRENPDILKTGGSSPIKKAPMSRSSAKIN